MGGIRARWGILPFLLSFLSLRLCSPALTFISELKPKECELCSTRLSCPSCKEGGNFLHGRGTEVCYCVLPIQVQYKTPWTNKTHVVFLFLQGWVCIWAHLLKLI